MRTKQEQRRKQKLKKETRKKEEENQPIGIFLPGDTWKQADAEAEETGERNIQQGRGQW